MVMVGIACVVFCFLYTTLFSYHGLGDILVLLFFGIIPVCCTYYVCMPLHQQIPTGEVIASSIACGLAIDALLIVNNYRDIDNDRSNGKITLAVRLGESKTRRLYESIGYIAAGIMIILVFFDLYQTDKFIPTYAIYLIYIILHRQSPGSISIRAYPDPDRQGGEQGVGKHAGAKSRNSILHLLPEACGHRLT